ncbi:MAG TPA: hypothetical protein VMR46_00475 [Candidatus Paceibacterota bacterium]|nr:hypothetical protein [Candidatus Paceibacterota bacterium]
MNNARSYVLVAVVVVACLFVAGFFFTKKESPQIQPSAFDPLNATYLIDGTPVALVNGKASTPVAPGSAEVVTTQIFGEPVYGDVSGDGTNDAAVFLVQTGAGSGTFYYAAAALDSGHGALGTNAVLLGDRIAPNTIQIANGIMIVNYAERKPGEPMSASPSVGVSKYLVESNGTLYDTPTDIYPLPPGFTWGGKGVATISQGGSATSTLVGIQIESEPILNITDLSAKTLPFDAYYKQKLAAAGWSVDNALAAGGPGAEITGYTKGAEYIVLQFSSVFKNTPQNSPETCPCDMTFSVFGGSKE